MSSNNDFNLTDKDMNNSTSHNESEDSTFLNGISEAAKRGDVECIKIMIQDVDNWQAVCNNDRSDKNPVINAALGGHSNVVSILKGAGADLDKALTCLFTVWKIWSVKVKIFIKASFILLDNGAEAIKANFPYVAIATNVGNAELVERLLESKAQVDVPGAYGYTALVTASQKGYADIARCLLKYNAHVDYQASFGEWTPLMHAVFRNHYDVAKVLLIEGKANPNITDADRTSALFLVPPNQDSVGLPLAKLLLENGADVNFRNTYKETILLEFLKSSAHNHDYEVSNDFVKLFLDHGWNVNLPNCCGYTPLMYACHLGNQAEALIQLLLSAGANVNAKSRTYGYVRHVTPLIVAMDRVENLRTVTRFDLCAALLKHGATVRNKTQNSVTDHLHIAISKGLTAVVERMIQVGGLPRIHLYMDLIRHKPSHLSPLHAAFLFQNTHLIRMFLRINFLPTGLPTFHRPASLFRYRKD